MGTLAVVTAAATNFGLMSARNRDWRPPDQRCWIAVRRASTRRAFSFLGRSQASPAFPAVADSPSRFRPTASSSISTVPRYRPPWISVSKMLGVPPSLTPM